MFVIVRHLCTGYPTKAVQAKVFVNGSQSKGMQFVTAIKVDVLLMVHPHQEADTRVLVFLLLLI